MGVRHVREAPTPMKEGISQQGFVVTQVDNVRGTLPTFEAAAAAVGISPEELADLGRQAWGRDS